MAVFALEKTECDECVKKIPRGPRVKAEAAGQRFQALGSLGEFGKDLHLNGTQQCFRRPESEAGLQNVIG